MSRYGIDKVLHSVALDQAARDAFGANVQAYLQGQELEPAEQEALARRDIRTLYTLGAHPFLLYSFALALEGAFSIPWVTSYVQQLAGLPVSDFAT